MAPNGTQGGDTHSCPKWLTNDKQSAHHSLVIACRFRISDEDRRDSRKDENARPVQWKGEYRSANQKNEKLDASRMGSAIWRNASKETIGRGSRERSSWWKMVVWLKVPRKIAPAKGRLIWKDQRWLRGRTRKQGIHKRALRTICRADARQRKRKSRGRKAYWAHR